MPGDPKVRPAPRAQLDNEEVIDGPKAKVDHRQKATGSNLPGMILQEGVPILGMHMGRPDPTKVGMDGVLGDANSEFEEFAANTFRPPAGILGRHLLNQRDQLLGETRTARSGTTLETPVKSESLTVPAEERVGLKDQESLFPRGKPAGEQ